LQDAGPAANRPAASNTIEDRLEREQNEEAEGESCRAGYYTQLKKTNEIIILMTRDEGRSNKDNGGTEREAATERRRETLGTPPNEGRKRSGLPRSPVAPLSYTKTEIYLKKATPDIFNFE